MDRPEPADLPSRTRRHPRALDHPLPLTTPQSFHFAIGHLHSCHLSFKDQAIFDWLEILRFARKEIQKSANVDQLDDSVFIALAALSSADDTKIRECALKDHTVSKSEFEQFHENNAALPRRSVNSTPSSFRNSQASSRKFPRYSAYPTPRSSLYSFSSKHSSLLQSDIDLNGSLPSPLHERPAEAPENTIASPPSDIVSKNYRCTTGEHLPKACSSTFNAFKRHELEHIEKYHCILRDSDLVHESLLGKECLLCGKPEPDPRHFAEHKIRPCLERDEPLLFTRQDILAKHLKEKHAVPTFRTRLLTKKWSYQLQKTAFSCGICVDVLFRSKLEQINHIRHKHSRESMKLWCETTMMRSLLRHPKVNQAWQQIIAQHPQVEEQRLSWPQSVLPNVRLELDLNRETAEDFAAAAFRSAVIDFGTTRHGDTSLLPPFTAEAKMDISEPPFESTSSLYAEDYRNIYMADSFGLDDFDSWNTRDSADDIIMSQPAQHPASLRIVECLATPPFGTNGLQGPYIRTSSHEVLDEPHENCPSVDAVEDGLISQLQPLLQGI